MNQHKRDGSVSAVVPPGVTAKTSASGSAADKDSEMLRLHKWCRIVLQAMERMDPQTTLYADLMRNLDETLRRRRIAALRVAARDVLEWVRGLKPADQAVIDKALRSELGSGLSEDSASMREEVRAIVRRGAIRDDDEYRLVRSWADMESGPAERTLDVATLVSLMDQYIAGRK